MYFLTSVESCSRLTPNLRAVSNCSPETELLVSSSSSNRIQACSAESNRKKYLPPANEVYEGYVFTPVCHSVHRGDSRRPTRRVDVGGLAGGVLKAHIQGEVWGGLAGEGGLQAHTQRGGGLDPGTH